MASVFLSYDHEDASVAAAIASALEKAGHAVWWDRRIHGGAEYNLEIESAVERSDAVVVLWSQRSVNSAWVRDEAGEGRDQRKLVPVLIDEVKPPMGFRQFQNIDLSKMRGGRIARNLSELLDALDKVSAAAAAKSPAFTPRPIRPRRLNRASLVILGTGILSAAGVTAWRLIGHSPGAPVIRVAPADSSPASEGLARDVLVKLGSLQAAKTEAMRLTGADTSSDSVDLIVEASSSKLAPQANLSLLAGNDRTLLWSKDFQLGPGGLAAAEQQMAYTTSEVLGCALEAARQGEVHVDQQTLKLFLNGCSQFGDDYYQEPAAVVPLFSTIVANFPKFQPAWRKLLLADTLVARNEQMFEDRFAPGRLRQDIAIAHKLNPAMPEIYVAKTELLPLNAYAERLALLDRAVRLAPDDPDVLVSRSVHLAAVGRISDGLDDANRAVEIDPLSAGLRGVLIMGLAYDGKMDAAEDQLRRAQELWPDAPTIEDARLRVNMRFGDARDALNTMKSDPKRRQNLSPNVEAYLIARIHPTPSNIERAINAASGANLKDTNTLAHLMQMLGQFHRENELYDVLLNPRWVDLLGSTSQIYFRASLHKFRQDPRFMIVARRAGLVDYWRETGKWPDFSFEPDLPYDCKKEAAKLAA
jgi:Flp pilus assembly protein TadD